MSDRFPHDAPRARVIKAFEKCGFQVTRQGNHIALSRTNSDGSVTPMTLPGHSVIKGSTLRHICTQSGIERDKFLSAYNDV